MVVRQQGGRALVAGFASGWRYIHASLVGFALLLSAGNALALTTPEIVRLNSPAVVQVSCEKLSGAVAMGTGFVVDERGIVITNLHVVQGASSIKVHLKAGDVFNVVRVLATDPVRDLAVLRIAAFGLATTRWGNSDSVSVGDPVVAMGNPLGFEGTVTQGIVSSIRVDERAGYRLIQTDAAASAGNSGGPLLDAQGRVIGVVTFKARGENLNFAVPINYVRGLMDAPRGAGFEALASSAQDSSGGLAGLGIPVRWRSLSGGPSWNIRKEGDYLTLQAVFESHLLVQGARRGGVLKRVGTSWVGQVSGTHVCNLNDFFSGRSTSKLCQLDEEMVITEFSDRRIIGFTEGFRADDSGFDCARCRVRGARRQLDFVWIPD